MDDAPINEQYTTDVTRVVVDDREFILVGTAHISQKSADLVREVIETEQPDTVCVELDPQRYAALANERRWESLDLRTIIRNKQLTTLFINLILAAYQKRLGNKLGVMPGAELLEATKVAEAADIPISLCDRDVRITLRRAWHAMSFIERAKLMASALVGLVEGQEISEEDLTRLREKDVLSELMNELGRIMPVLKTVLIDERDTYLAEKIKASEGNKLVAVVGAGHVNGMIEALKRNDPVDLAKIEVIPPVSPLWKIAGWGIPVLILGAIGYIGYSQGLGAAGDNLQFWILANGIPSAIGALIALAHPVTIISAFIAAPITSLTPVIGAGYVTAFVQAYFNPPLVREFHTVIDDVNTVSKWWSNRLLRILLVFLLTSLGSAIGTYVGAYEIITNLFQ